MLGNFLVLGIYKNLKCWSIMLIVWREGEGSNMNIGIDKYLYYYGDIYKVLGIFIKIWVEISFGIFLWEFVLKSCCLDC